MLYDTVHARTQALHHEDPRLIIDAAELRPDFFEIMALKPSGREIETRTAYSLQEAAAAYGDLLAKYATPAEKPAAPAAPAPLVGKYAQLRDYLARALEYGRLAEKAEPEDGGASNFDAPALLLPRWREALVRQAAKEAGATCSTWKSYAGKRYIFNPDTRSQGNARTRNAETMAGYLSGAGYDVLMYYQAD